jgi:3-oxoadipate CoA-transferase beta subunit
VNRVYTDLAVIDVTADGLRVVEMVDGLDLAQLIKLSGVPLAMQDVAAHG